MNVHRPRRLLLAGALLLVAAVFQSCSDGRESLNVDESVLAVSCERYEPVVFKPRVDLVRSTSELREAWSALHFAGPISETITDRMPLLFVSTVESSSCPIEVSRLGPPPDDVEADLQVDLARSTESDCTADGAPVTFVIASPSENIERVFVNSDDSEELSGVVIIDE